MMIKRRTLLALCALLPFAGHGADATRNYPDRPIRLIMPNAPGSSTDTMGRIVAAKLGEVLGQQLVVDNRAGAGGSIGMEIGKTAAPDGYTLIVTSLGALTVSPHIRKVAYDPVRDFEYVAMYSRQGNVLVVNTALPVKNVRDFLDYAKAQKGKLVMASAGNGAQSHLNGTSLMTAGGFNSLHVPYKGGGPSVSAVVAGEAQWTIVPSAAVMSLVRSGRLRALGHSLPNRSALFPPDIPPIGETLTGFKYVAFSGILAPNGVPKPILDKLRAAMARVVAAPDIREQFAAQGAEPATGTPDEFRKAIAEELAEMGKIVKVIGLKAD